MPEVKAIKFRNFTERDFSWNHGGIEYTFKAGEEMYLEDFKARHFAKHLIDRELTLMSPKNEDWTGNMVKRAELEIKCFPSSEAVSSEKALDIEAKKKEEETEEKPGEEEFPDLKTNDSVFAVPKKAEVGRPRKEDNE